MAENILYDSSESEEEQLYSLPDIRDEDTETSEELNVKLEELTLEESGRKGAKCESCVREKCPESERAGELYESIGSWWRELSERYEPAREFYGRVAVFFCFLCKMFVCAECLPKHQWHEGQKVEREESEVMREQRERERNKGKGLGKETKRMRLETESERKKENEGYESDRMRETTERERKRRVYIEKLFQSENETERTEKMFSSHAVICDRADVKHELDQEDCSISGLCVLENKRLVVCDWWNSCIEIFKMGGHVLQRYIRIVGSESGPRNVTEIDLKRNSTEPKLVSGSSSDISVTDRADPDKQCLIAVTLPWECQIMFIDLSKKPAKAQKTIKTEEECYSIQFYDDKMFTVCRKDRFDPPCSIYIYSTDGDTLNKFYIGIYGSPAPHLAVVSGRVYITDGRNNKVECRNVEGQLISEITIEGSWPAGISVDPDNNVYVCAREHNKVYKLDADLTRYMSVLDQTTDYIERPVALCYYRDKLFISHGWPPSLGNFVTVVRLL